MHPKSLEVAKAAQLRIAIAQGQIAAVREVRAYCVGQKIKQQEVNGRVEQLINRLPVPAKQAISSKLCQLITGEQAMQQPSILDRIPEPAKPLAIGAIASSIVALLLVGGSAIGGIKQQSWGTWAGVTGVTFVGSSLAVWMRGSVRSPEQRGREGSHDSDAFTNARYAPANVHPTYTKLAIACGENIAQKQPGPEFDRTLELSERMLGHVREATTPALASLGYQTVAFSHYETLGEGHAISRSSDTQSVPEPRPQFVLPQGQAPATEAIQPIEQPLPTLELSDDSDLYEDAWGQSEPDTQASPFQELYQ